MSSPAVEHARIIARLILADPFATRPAKAAAQQLLDELAETQAGRERRAELAREAAQFALCALIVAACAAVGVIGGWALWELLPWS